ncbi:DUF4364 family protein [Anaeromicropila herbilytica]|uniref:DUF4364 family protein n=1 Tax=Anaeromicropila herbilytica TaxID=2785025 RepID=A0A7R7EJN7_9FIRM|nr:DUF4364 family protein [Anaeromicropila herbilytica]BCN29687.1 hypothetical protein bsdtb5_09820 [Anaeromicropila herbilytica]
MSNESLTLYKLIILFILDKVDFAMTNAQISDFILEKEYTNYFNIQQAISELVDSELIIRHTIRNSSHYKITPSGQETLEFFNTKISDAIKKDIEEYLHVNKYTLREEVSTISDYFQSKKDEYMVRCQVKERGTAIIDLSIAVPTEDEAILICNSWKSKSQDVYAYLIRTLMNPDN